MIGFKESLSILKKYKIPICRSYFSLDLSVLEKRMKNLEKAVLKVYSRDVIHKTEMGAIMTDIRGVDELRRAYKKILENVFSFKDDARIESFVLQEQVKGLEVIIGGKTDEVFGKVIVFGAGGIYTEIYRDVSLRSLPLRKDDVEDMVRQTKVYEILRGYRGKKYDFTSLYNLILKSARMFLKEKIKEFDFNPVIVTEKGAYVVDWRFLR
ncbi:MAG: acetate--CoA ligase family protein [Candidatus Aenigmarchaeota archaeon]|nr:acetate--CoA ligase family protein [Candidatus Aenigmarchaeota archaeon]MDW8160093.1 acetate--CoA ligase family protein [Candidatus Aenigmarchaeota archaeon]